jgi:hypothetical protein
MARIGWIVRQALRKGVVLGDRSNAHILERKIALEHRARLRLFPSERQLRVEMGSPQDYQFERAADLLRGAFFFKRER